MKRKINILLLTLSIIIGAGCSQSFLDTAPTDAISAEAALSSPDNMMLVLNGLHRMMYAQSPLDDYDYSSRSGQSHFLPMFDAMGGNIIHSSPGNGWMRSDLQWKTHIDPNLITVRMFWYERYHFIASCNSIINKVEEDQLVKDALMNNILGQAHAYRAWAYHQLVTTYAKGYMISSDPSSEPGVPLLFATEAPYTSEPRSSVETIYNQIETDIDLAIDYLKNASSPNNKSHISLNAAYGIKARIALSKGDWATAATAAAQARDGYALIDETDWKSGFNTYDLSEVIWGGHVIDTETNYFQSYFYYICFTFNGTQNRTNPKIISKELYNMIPETDYRRDAWLPMAPNTYSAASNGEGGIDDNGTPNDPSDDVPNDPNYADVATYLAAKAEIIETYGATSAHNTHPYMSVKFLQKNPGTIDPDDVIYMRSSEMYLIEAEAKAMLNDVEGAQDALAVLGEARDVAFDKTVFDTNEKLMDEIKFQRRVELWGEGFSFHDQIRWDEGLDQTNSGASSVLYQDGFQQAKPSENNDWIWKIPQAEIDANPNLTASDQN